MCAYHEVVLIMCGPREREGGERIAYAAYVTYSTVYIIMEVTLHEQYIYMHACMHAHVCVYLLYACSTDILTIYVHVHVD